MLKIKGRKKGEKPTMGSMNQDKEEEEILTSLPRDIQRTLEKDSKLEETKDTPKKEGSSLLPQYGIEKTEIKEDLKLNNGMEKEIQENQLSKGKVNNFQSRLLDDDLEMHIQEMEEILMVMLERQLVMMELDDSKGLEDMEMEIGKLQQRLVALKEIQEQRKNLKD